MALPVVLTMLTGTAQAQRTVVPIDRPRFLQVELLEATPLGAYVSFPSSGNGWYTGLRAAKLTYHSGKGFRAGISALDAGGVVMQYGLWAVAPIHIGYDIVLNPRKMAFFYGTVPSCYVEATLGAFPPYAKLAAACDVDWYGVGTGIEFGVIDWNPPNSPQGSTPVSSSACPTPRSGCADAGEPDRAARRDYLRPDSGADSPQRHNDHNRKATESFPSPDRRISRIVLELHVVPVVPSC